MKPTWCTFHSVLLRIKVFYMFRALLAHPQEAPHKQHLVYYVCIMLVGCTTIAVTCSSSGGATQTAFGILRAYNVSWLWHDCSGLVNPQEVLHQMPFVQLLLRINKSTAIVAQPTDVIRTQYTKCCLCSTSWGWASPLQSWHSQLTYARNIPIAVCVAPKDEQVMLETCRGL
jgi:hypothetical protein